MTKRAEEGLRATLRLLMLFLRFCCAFVVLLIYPPRLAGAEHRRTKVEQPRADAGEAWMPKRFQTGAGMACLKTHLGREAQGTIITTGD